MKLQTNPTDLIQFMGMTTKELTLIGLLFIIAILLAYFLIKAHKKSSRLQDDRLTEAKDYADNLRAIGEKFMIQTNKILII